MSLHRALMGKLKLTELILYLILNYVKRTNPLFLTFSISRYIIKNLILTIQIYVEMSCFECPRLLCSNGKITAHIRDLYTGKMLDYGIGSFFVIGQLYKGCHGV